MTGRPSYAVRVNRAGPRWRVELLAQDAEDELPVLERALGEDGGEWPPPFVIVVDSGLYFVVLRHGPGGMVRALISDATMLEWLLAAEVVDRYGIAVDTEGAFDDDESGWPGGDLAVFTDDGLPADQLRSIVTADDLWADEMVALIAERLGFADELGAAVSP
jgi:putative tRNA adenosine deaminase-associated protein